MKPGVKVALCVPGGHNAYLGVLDQPVVFGGERRWSVRWDDGQPSGNTTWPEEWLRRVVPGD